VIQLGRPPVIPEIIELHFEELDFLWELREGVVFAPDWDLEDLRAHEERAEAHLDGLRLAELHGVELARPQLRGEETFAATAAAFTLMGTGDPELQAEVVRALEAAESESADGIRIGLRHCDISQVAEDLAQLVRSADPSSRARALDVLAFHRLPAPDGALELLRDPDEQVRRLCFGAAARLGLRIEEAQLAEALAAEDPSLRRAALEACARLGTASLLHVCRSAATRGNAPAAEALEFLGALGDAADLPLLQAALQNSELAVAALRGLGALGSVGSVPLIISLMEDAELAIAAGGAYTRITGDTDIAGERPEAASDDEEAEGAEEARPPDPALARAHWELQARQLDPAGRWQSAIEVSRDPLGPGFDSLPLESRRDVYLGARSRRGAAIHDLELERRALLQRSRA
jgi:uncharacterized protein (TIGR02270 family)